MDWPDKRKWNGMCTGPVSSLVLTEACPQVPGGSGGPARRGQHRTADRGTPGSSRSDSTDGTWDTQGWHGQDHTPGEVLGSGAVTWGGRHLWPASTGAGWAAHGLRAGSTLSSVPRKRARGAGTLPFVPRPWCCLKNWRPLARVCDRAPWARRAFEAQLLRVQDGVRSLARWGRRICSRGALFGSDLCRRASAKPATGKATWGFPRPGRPLPMSGPGTEDTGRPVSCGSRGLCALGCP